jgi:hypothetical protein
MTAASTMIDSSVWNGDVQSLVHGVDGSLGSAGAGRSPLVDLWVRRGAALLVAGVAAYSSYEHQRLFAAAGGTDQAGARLWPLSVVLWALLLASIGLLRSGPDTRCRHRRALWVAFGLGIAVSLAANVAAAPALGWQPILVAGWPPVALLLAAELIAQRPSPQPHPDRQNLREIWPSLDDRAPCSRSGRYGREHGGQTDTGHAWQVSPTLGTTRPWEDFAVAIGLDDALLGWLVAAAGGGLVRRLRGDPARAAMQIVVEEAVAATVEEFFSGRDDRAEHLRASLLLRDVGAEPIRVANEAELRDVLRAWTAALDRPEFGQPGYLSRLGLEPEWRASNLPDVSYVIDMAVCEPWLVATGPEGWPPR